MNSDAMRHAWWLGFGGLAGALVLGIGDQCLYFATVSGTEFNAHVQEIAANTPLSRALFGAALAPFAALLYLAGFAHLCAHVRVRQPRLAGLIWIALALCILAGACYHALWGARILALKSAGLAVGAHGLPAALHEYAADIYAIVEWSGYPALALLAILIVTGRSDYPRWFCLLLPIAPMWLLQAMTTWVPAPFGSVVAGSASNLAFALCFAVSLAITQPTRQGSACGLRRDREATTPSPSRSRPRDRCARGSNSGDGRLR